MCHEEKTVCRFSFYQSPQQVISLMSSYPPPERGLISEISWGDKSLQTCVSLWCCNMIKVLHKNEGTGCRRGGAFLMSYMGKTVSYI